MKKLSPRERIILIITVGLMLVFIIVQLVIKPMMGSAINIDDQIRLIRAHLIKAHRMVAIKQQVEVRYQNLVGLIGVAGSQGSEITAMVSKIELAAHESNIQIANIQPQEAVAQKEIQFFPVELQIDGQWLDVVRFLHALQQAPNFYFIDELNLEKYSDTVNSLRGRIVISCLSIT